MSHRFYQFCFNLGITFTLLISFLSHADDKKDREDLGLLLAVSINANDFTRVDKVFDMDFFIRRVAEGLLVPEAEKEGFAKGMRKGVGNGLIKQMFAGLENQEKRAKFIGILTIDNQRKPVVRVDYTEGGVNFIELELHKVGSEYKIVDIYIAANGQRLSDTVMQAGMMLMQQPTGLIAKLVGEQSSREGVIKTFRQAMDFKRQGNMQAMYEKLQELPDSVKQNDVIALMSVMTSSYIGEAIYKKELDQFARFHGNNPRYGLMLVDHYYYRGQYDKALESLSGVITRYQQDSSLLILRASIYMLQKKYTKATQDIELALSKEPDNEDAYWTAVTISINKKSYDETLVWLEKLESQFDYEFVEENFQGQDLYQDFIASREFRRWIASRSE